MTPKQAAFVREYLVDLNATQAAIRAGYSERTANEQASRLLANVNIAAAVQAAQDARSVRTEITADKVLERLWAIATVDVNELVEFRREPCHDCWLDAAEALDAPRGTDEPNAACVTCHGDGSGRPVFKDTRKLSPAARALYAGVKVTKDGMEVKMANRDRALELLGDHLGLFGKRVELTGKDGAPLPGGTTVLGGVTPEQLAAAVRAALDKV